MAVASLAKVRSTWLRPRALSLHVAVAVCTPTFSALGWWQLHRALAGNTLSWAYTFEWPIFAVYGVCMWWKLVHDEDPPTKIVDSSAEKAIPEELEDQLLASEPPAEATTDKRLAAYNAYLAQLHAKDRHDAR